MNFLKDERGNITLWILFIGACFLVIVVWIIIFHIIQDYIFPLGVASGADQTQTYNYMVAFIQWFPVISLFGYAIYAIKNSQKPEQPQFGGL
jgi:hypothetical protein